MTDVHEFDKNCWSKIHSCRFVLNCLLFFCYIHVQVANTLWMLGLGCYFISGCRKYSYSSYMEKAISVSELKKLNNLKIFGKFSLIHFEAFFFCNNPIVPPSDYCLFFH